MNKELEKLMRKMDYEQLKEVLEGLEIRYENFYTYSSPSPEITITFPSKYNSQIKSNLKKYGNNPYFALVTGENIARSILGPIFNSNVKEESIQHIQMKNNYRFKVSALTSVIFVFIVVLLQPNT